MKDITEQLEKVFAERLKTDELMSKYSNFRIGGPAKWFVEVRAVEELVHALRIAKDNGIQIFVFGGASNILVNDDGFDGLVIKMAMRRIQIEGTTVRAEAGVLMTTLARQTAEKGLSGLEWAITLPGTLGGGVRGNAGCFGGETWDHIKDVEVYSRGEIQTRKKEDVEVGYRDSAFKRADDIILAATFELENKDVEELKSRMDEILEKRKVTQPTTAGSAGCMFKNYEIKDNEIDHLKEKLDLPESMINKNQISAGWLIEKMDLKGKQIGGAQISDKHGNFLINTGDATADHVAQLVALVKTRARDEYGILLKEEVQYVGF
jgi:UDP-N-acetylmuramate dehydrogenase